MQTIVFACQKGGSGKTTLCAHLAVEAERAGDGPVYLIDTDPQGSLTVWHEQRRTETPRRVDLPLEQLTSGLAELQDAGAAYVLVDTPPAEHPARNKTLFGRADLVVVPVRPSFFDLEACKPTLLLLQSLERPFLFIVNQVKSRSLVTAQAVAALSHYGPVARTLIADRVAYAALQDGRTAPERHLRGPAAEEITTLWSDLLEKLPAPAARRQHA